jgi:hypothetical protein
MTHDDFGPTEAENAALRGLPRTLAPPQPLEDRVVAALRAEGVLKSARPGRLLAGSMTFRFGAVAATLVLFVAGVVAGRLVPRAVAPEDPRPQFVLLLQEGKEFDAGTDHVAEYSAWARSLGARGLIVAGEKLKDDAVVLSRKDAGVSIQAESVTSEEAAPRGYFVIRARDLVEAIAIAQDCPHLKHGGRISLRPIDKV